MNTAFALRTLPICALGLLLLTSCDQILERTLDCDLAGNDYLDAPRTKEARISWIWQASEPASMNCRSVFLVGVDYWPKGRPAGFGSPGWQPSAAEAEQLDAMNSSPAPVRVFITTTTRAEPFAAPPLRAKTIEDLTPSVEGFEVCHSGLIEGKFWTGCFVQAGLDPDAVSKGEKGEPVVFEIDVYWTGQKGIDYPNEAVVDIDARMYYEKYYQD